MIPRALRLPLAFMLTFIPASAGADGTPPPAPLNEDSLKGQSATTRLCGTWNWTIHNHRSHQEQKTALVLLPPGAQAPPEFPQPSQMIVMGDAVYLRWDFQRGFQEDSLLLSGEDRRLEGTFKNTAGDWGAITGKLVTPCSGMK